MSRLSESLPFMIFEEVRDGSRYAQDLFTRKFSSAIPNYPHHFIALYRGAAGSLHVASYGHVIVHDGMGLGGGSCTDERVLRMMSSDERATLRSAGGPHCNLIRFIFSTMAERVPVVFAYCGDSRAQIVDLRAGFETTDYPHLLRRAVRSVEADELIELTRRAAARGPF